MKKPLIFFLFFALYFLSHEAFADTIYFKDGTTEKGLVVEEYYDRFVFNIPDEGEEEILKSKIDEIFFNEPYQNNLYIGKKFEGKGDFEKALQFYQLALQSNPDFRETQDAIKGLEDAKWHFNKNWRYRDLKDILKAQLGIRLRKIGEKIAIKALDKQTSKESDLLIGDVIVSCWAKYLTYAGLKNASRILIGLSNTILKIVIERDVHVKALPSIRLSAPFSISMEFEGPIVKTIKEESSSYKAGLREGDLIVKIDGENTRYMKLKGLKRKIFKNKSITLTIRREVTLMRKRSEKNNTQNAMWVWHSKEILLNKVKRKELLDFCKKKDIQILFFQLQYQFIPYKGKTICRLLHETKLRSFLKEAHAEGLKVHILDGAADFCLKEKHHLVLEEVKAILDFNKKYPAPEQIDGIHYDNEPYLLPGFHSAKKEEIINQFLTLNKECKKLISSSESKLEFGIDIPFWFDQVGFLDKRLIDICDNVGIMAYRNYASGPDGMIRLALDELKYAAEARKKVFVGVETSKYPKQEVYFISRLDEDVFNKFLSEEETSWLAGGTRFNGFSLKTYTDNKKTYIGLMKPEKAAEEDFKKVLFELGAAFGGIAKPEDEEELSQLTFDAIEAISQNPEFRDIRYQQYESKDGASLLMFVTREVMLEKLTFADLTQKDFNKVLTEAKKEFERHTSFAGFAIHYYRSYKALCEKD